VITETITFKFENAEQQRRFRQALAGIDVVVVPREPTGAMLMAGKKPLGAFLDNSLASEEFVLTSIWRAMVSVVESPAQQFNRK
jgi:hypothetical protein